MPIFPADTADRPKGRQRPGGSLQASFGMPERGRKPRLLAIDFLRILAMIAVMVVHVSSTYLDSGSRYTFLGMNLAFFLNQGARFCVPLFFLLSGFSLGTGEGGYLAFLKKRVVRVAAPYVVWTLLYLWSNVGFDWRAWLAQLGDLPRLLRTFLTGEAAPHLYFIPILFQFYLLYPLLCRWVRRRPFRSALWSFVITFFLLGAYMLSALGALPPVGWPYVWMLFPFWLFYFVAGMCLRRLDFSRLSAFCRRNAGALLAAALLFALVYSALSAYTGVLNAMKTELIPVTLLVFLCGVGLWERGKGVGWLRKAVAFLAGHSMGIYFNHVMVLCFLRQFSRFQQGMSGMLLLFLATFSLALLVAVGLRALGGLLGRRAGA